MSIDNELQGLARQIWNMESAICNAERSEAEVDAFTAEVIRSSVVAITDEMKTNLMRTAYNMIIYEAEDFTVGLFDADGNTISIGLGLPMFIRGLSDAIKAKLEHWGKENIHPGDILLTNDPQVMGSHLNHMIFSLPIFHDGELIAFSSSMGHWQDVGGVLGAVTRDVFSEGLQMPFVKIFKAGKQDMELTEIIRSNCRLPHFAMGDFRAQIAAIRTGERRVTRLLERYGAETFKQSIKLIFDQSEKLARAAVAKIPGRRLRGRVVHGRRRRQHRQTYSDQSTRRSEGRRDDRRSERREPAGGRALQFRRDGGAFGFAKSLSNFSRRRCSCRSMKARSGR